MIEVIKIIHLKTWIYIEEYKKYYPELEKNKETVMYLPMPSNQVKNDNESNYTAYITIYDNSETNINISSILGENFLNKNKKFSTVYAEKVENYFKKQKNKI